MSPAGSGPPSSTPADQQLQVQALLFESSPTRVYRARTADGRPVILKSASDDADPAAAAAGIHHEFEIAQAFDSDHVVRVYGLDRNDQRLGLVLEDFGGRSLDRIIDERTLPLEEVLEIAIQVVTGLAEIHAAGIIHKDINPSNIVYNPDTGVVKIIDFGISSYLTREQADMGNPTMLEGSLPYLSPEQTGRMNRALDYRTDFYSLGATLYELLARRPLFPVTAPIEWLHSHIAREPVPLERVAPQVPSTISDLVGRLLAKAADDRYRSAAGIRADLERCLEDYRAHGDVTPFPLGRQDRPHRFQIRQHLYGRSDEIARLMKSFDRASTGDAELVLVCGYSGIGKSCLIKELYRPITGRRGFFVAGKFDQLHRNVPLSGPLTALRDLIRQLLTESEEVLAGWRSRLLQALGDDVQLVADLIPDLRLITGEPPPRVPQPAKRASEHRLRRALVNFLGVFCQAEHPLVMFLDDLQWADAATLGLWEHLLTEASLQHLLLIGAYRDNEVTSGHPLRLTVERIRAHAVVDELALPPLSLDHLTELLADALYADRREVAPLAALVEQKTGGNPYFTEEFLKDLYHRELISYDPERSRWAWDMAGIADERMTDNVVDLMAEKLARLSPAARELLQVAACIGHRLELDMLLAVCGRPWRELAPALREAMSQGLIAPLGSHRPLLSGAQEPAGAERALELAFAHDRIQQAAHDLLDDADRHAIHLRIGRILVSRLAQADRDEHLFRITDHLNSARDLIDSAEERLELCGWNRAAGRSAWHAAAYDAAFEYFASAIRLLRSDAWEADAESVRLLYADAAESACLSARYDACEHLLDEALARTPEPLDAGRLNQIRLRSLIAQGLHSQALELGKSLMAKLGVHYPRRITQLHLITQFLWVRRRLRRVTLDDLRRRIVRETPLLAHRFAIGEQLAAAAQFADPRLLSLMALRGVRGALQHGITERALNAFGGVGVQLCMLADQPDEGQKYCKLALGLCDAFPESAARARLQLNQAAFVIPWVQPLRESLEPLTRAYELCLERADFDGAAQAVTYRLSYAAFSGAPLSRVSQEVRDWRPAVVALNQREAVAYLDSFHQMLLNLQGEADEPAALKGPAYDIDAMLPQHQQLAAWRLILAAQARQGTLEYLFDEPERALASLDAVRHYLRDIETVFDGMHLHFHDALVRLAVARRRTGSARRRLLRQAQRSRRVVARWARRIPANALAKHHLLEAEWHRTRRDEVRAQRYYDRAIDAAREHRLPPDEAYANRLAGEMHFEAGRGTIAEAYLGKARDAFALWGASGIVRHVEARHRVPPTRNLPQQVSEPTAATTSGEALLAGVDLTALMKALKSIAEERVSSRMVRAIIDTAMEFAGAQHGVLVLRDDRQQLRVEAEVSVDGGAAQILQSVPVAQSNSLSQAVVNYVIRTRESVVVHDAQELGGPIPGLSLDRRVNDRRVCSILGMPIIASGNDQSELIGLLYLENNHASHTFTEQRFETLEIICVAAAGRLELSRKAAVDGLTGLFNRDYFQTMLRQEVAASQRHGRPLALILGDIDHFKRFNDTWGHQVGDEVLKAVADALRTTCRESDVVARYGGEELAVILPDTDASGARALAERVREAVAAVSVTHGDASLAVTLSLGVASLDTASGGEDDLLRQADIALYDAKHAGRNRVCAA